MKIKNTKYLKFISIIVLASLVIALMIGIYKIGQLNGIIIGATTMLTRNNETMCSLMNEYDSDIWEDNGVCIINDNATYNEIVHCPFGTFETRGGIEPDIKQKIRLFREKALFYPFFGCW